jgi:hypothetical protein
VFESRSSRPLAVAVADAALAQAAAALERGGAVMVAGAAGEAPAAQPATPAPSAGDGYLALAALAAAELLSDDSNYRAEATAALARPLAACLLAPPAAFASAWCGGDAARARHAADALPGGRPLAVAPPTPDAVARSASLAGAVAAMAGAKTAPHASIAAAARCVALFKILGNLHVVDPADASSDGRAARALVAGALAAHAAAVAGGGGEEAALAGSPGAAVAARLGANLRALRAAAAALRDAAEDAPPHAPDALVAPAELKLVDGLEAAVAAAGAAADGDKGAVAAVLAARKRRG